MLRAFDTGAVRDEWAVVAFGFGVCDGGLLVAL